MATPCACGGTPHERDRGASGVIRTCYGERFGPCRGSSLGSAVALAAFGVSRVVGSILCARRLRPYGIWSSGVSAWSIWSRKCDLGLRLPPVASYGIQWLTDSSGRVYELVHRA